MRTLTTLALCTLAGLAHADTMYWFGTADTNWYNPANWANGRIPSSTDSAAITALNAGPLITSQVTVAGLWVQPNASLTAVAGLTINGHATIDGSVFLASSSALFVHRDDVNVSGHIVMWNGAALYHSADGAGNFNILASGDLTIPSYDTGGTVLGTGLHIFGRAHVQTSNVIFVGHRTRGMNPSTYIIVEGGGVLDFTHGLPVGASYFSDEVPPFLVNSGSITAVGPTDQSVNFGSDLAFYNEGYISTSGLGFSPAGSYDIDQTGTLVRGTWVARDGGLFIFPFVTINAIGPSATIELSGPGSNFVSFGSIADVQGQFFINQGAQYSSKPASGSFVNHGVLTIDQDSSLSVNGQFRQAPGADLALFVGGPFAGEHSSITATSASLAGQVDATFTNDFTALQGTTIPFLSTGQPISGQFAQLTCYNSYVPYTLSYDFAQAALVAGCASDFNGDGFPDIYDFTDFVACFEGGACPPGKSADFNNDGFPDIYDFTDFVTVFETGC